MTVEGTQYRLEMPALGALADEDIANILTYIRREWEHGADPIDVATVKQARAETSSRNEAWSAKELLQIK